MKKIMALLLCLVMALTLVACGEKDTDKNNDLPNNDLPTNDQPNTAPNINGGTDRDDGGAENGVEGRSRSGGRTYGYDTYRADEMATWRQMLDNGRVRDTDGFLADGENASWS